MKENETKVEYKLNALHEVMLIKHCFMKHAFQLHVHMILKMYVLLKVVGQRNWTTALSPILLLI